MALEKNDFKQIKAIVEETVVKSENRINKKIDGVEKNLNTKINEVEDRITSIINREVGDLAEINRAVIDKVSKFDDLEKRITRVEHKVGIAG